MEGLDAMMEMASVFTNGRLELRVLLPRDAEIERGKRLRQDAFQSCMLGWVLKPRKRARFIERHNSFVILGQ